MKKIIKNPQKRIYLNKKKQQKSVLNRNDKILEMIHNYCKNATSRCTRTK